jgi:hypothetical protein
MKRPVFLALFAVAPLLHAQAPQPTTAQLKSWVEVRQERVDLLKDEIKQSDARLESRLDIIVDTLKSISDSKESRTKVARMKEETGKKLGKTISYYDQKRAALREELRNPRLRLTDEEKRKMIAAFDAKIQKRTQQILALNQSMPSHEEHERYKTAAGGWSGTEYQRNAEYEQNRRITSHSNSQRDAMIKQLDASIGRLDRQSRALQAQLVSASDPSQKKSLTGELDKTNALIEERKQQRVQTLNQSSTSTHPVALKEAMDLDKAIQVSVNELRRDFTTLFERYHSLVNELSALHTTEAALAAAADRN